MCSKQLFAALIAFTLLSVAALSARAQVTVIESEDGRPTVYKMTVSPATEPRPALKYHFLVPPVDKTSGNAATFYYKAMVIEGASDDLARQIAGSGVRVESGPRGPIIYAPDLETRSAFWERAPGSVLELEFCPESGEFWFQIIKGEACLGTFRPGETRSWDGTPFLSSVDGETDPGTIVEKLGIPRSFVAPKPGGLRRTAAKRS